MTPGRPAFEKAATQKAALQMEQAELASDPATWSEEKINMIRVLGLGFNSFIETL